MRPHRHKQTQQTNAWHTQPFAAHAHAASAAVRPLNAWHSPGAHSSTRRTEVAGTFVSSAAYCCRRFCCWNRSRRLGPPPDSAVARSLSGTTSSSSCSHAAKLHYCRCVCVRRERAATCAGRQSPAHNGQTTSPALRRHEALCTAITPGTSQLSALAAPRQFKANAERLRVSKAHVWRYWRWTCRRARSPCRPCACAATGSTPTGPH